MKRKSGGLKMSLVLPKKSALAKESRLSRMKQIAKKAMENGKFSVDDVRNELKNIRSKSN